MKGQTDFRIDRPRFYALAISAMTGQPFELPGVESWTYSKSDDGTSGSFTMRVPISQDYDTIVRTRFPGTEPYAQVVAPMDLIAIYAERTSVGTYGRISAPIAIRPSGLTLGSLNWGDDGAASVTALGTAACIVIGMVDHAEESGSPGSPLYLNISGRDLTKVFEVNDVGIPDAALTSANLPVPTQSGGSFQLQNILLSKSNSGTQFIEDVLDLLVQKDLSKLANVGVNTKSKFAASQISAYKTFGFPWRSFIRTDALDPAFQHLTKQAYPDYSPQAGAVWASLLELRNAPISRLFVNELGQLIFDDALGAWTSVASQGMTLNATNGYPYQRVFGTIGADDVRDYSFAIDDHDLATFLSVLPNNSTMGLNDITKAKGNYFRGSGFVNGVMEAASAAAAYVQTYGYRYAQFESQWDFDFEDAERRRKTVLTSMNTLYSGTVTLRGHPYFRVGTRWKLGIQTARPQTSNQTWYVRSVEASGNWGEDYTTRLSLAFPQGSGSDAFG